MSEKKGKLFGKLNIIDLLVILAVVAALVFLGVRLMAKSQSTDTAENLPRLEYVVKTVKVDPEVYENAKARIEAGENQLVTGSTTIDGYVKEIWAEPYITTVTTDDGQMVQAEDPYYLTVYTRVEGPMTNTVTKLVYTQETRIGNSNCVKTEGAQFIGTVISIRELE